MERDANPLSQEIYYLTLVCVSTLIVVLAIAGLLIYRGGRTHETKAVLDAIEGVRCQQSSHADETMGELKHQRSIINWMREAFDIYILRGKK